jgi:hypothetical protein
VREAARKVRASPSPPLAAHRNPPKPKNNINQTPGCKQAEVGDDDAAEPVCSECKGPNFVYNDDSELW